MKFKILLITLLFPFIAFSQAVVQDSVYGNVKSVREKLYFLDSIQQNLKLFSTEDEYGHNGFMSRDYTTSRFNTLWYKTPWVHYQNYLKEYDTLHKLVRETWYYKNNELLTTYEFKYNKEGKIIEEKEIDGEYINVTQKGYDYKNRLRSIYRYFSEVGFNFKSIEYNKEDLVDTEEYFMDNEGKTSQWRYEYNDGKQVRAYILKPYKLVESEDPKRKKMVQGYWTEYLRYEYEYDERGNKTLIKSYESQMEGSTGQPSKYYLKYDKNNNVVSEKDGLSEWTFKYDNNNDLLEQQHTYDNKIQISAMHAYKNNVLVKLVYTEAGVTSTATYTYRFDKFDNWTEQTKSINGKPLYIRKREIVYY
ncbi:hypothetical protein FMM05_10050 [Flavobacterium zepuense]|uniref:YD repeat-containing protein n=1 Tax=Flavobacterium zepuense TaxID=2593302 RepID=A0A552V2Z3_9FLAO|nr:hypothetical protein [Flavobacterium zepuense]TRW24832.1 hypothetical protein FMM05_10050 [Flavobacterium zepuense]